LLGLKELSMALCNNVMGEFTISSTHSHLSRVKHRSPGLQGKSVAVSCVCMCANARVCGLRERVLCILVHVHTCVYVCAYLQVYSCGCVLCVRVCVFAGVLVCLMYVLCLFYVLRSVCVSLCKCNLLCTDYVAASCVYPSVYVRACD
jgi:hypothetical protein